MKYYINGIYKTRIINNKIVFVNKYKSNEIFVVDNINNNILLDDNKIEISNKEILEELKKEKIIEVCHE